jgi:hypothetical protein
MNQNQRPLFYEGQYLSAVDLDTSVDYERFQLARHELGAHIWGIGIGLDLRERNLPSGDVEVSIVPGIAWDGYGRAIVVLAPVKVSLDKFVNFQSTTSAEGLLVKVWLRYDETTGKGPAAGFEACTAGSQYARALENYVIEVGEPPQGAHGPVSVAGLSIDPLKARNVFLPKLPDLFDESVAYQMFPESGSKPQWWIPVGYVRWLKKAGQPGTLIARNDSGSGGLPPDSDLIRAFRQYIGVVAETIVAADGALRLRHRNKDPAKANFQPPQIALDLKHQDLVWVEGNMRVFGDARLCGGLLELRNDDGFRDDVPQVMRRKKNPEGGLDVQIAFAKNGNPKGDNAFSVGLIDVDATSGDFKELNKHFVVRDNGRVGIGIAVPTQLLTLAGEGKTRLEIGRVNAGFPWSTNSPTNDGSFAINQQSQGSDNTGADLALKRDGKLRVVLGDVNTFISGQNGAVVLMINQGEPGEAEAMRVDNGGNVGIGTAAPVAKLQLAGDFAIEKIGSGAPRPLPADATLIWNDGKWLRLNQNLDFSKPIFGVHTPGLFAPNSLNVGGVNSWGDPGAGNAQIKGDTDIGGKITGNGGMSINGASSINGGLSVNGASSVNGGLSVNGDSSVNGDYEVTGSVLIHQNIQVLGGKSFVAAHPIAKDRIIVHACLEGPEAAVYYRGQGQLKKGVATIRLPDYFEGLTGSEDRTVQVTPLYEGKEPVVALAATAVAGGRFHVRAIGTDNPAQRFCWEVKAVRKDIPEFAVERPMTDRLRRALKSAAAARD